MARNTTRITNQNGFSDDNEDIFTNNIEGEAEDITKLHDDFEVIENSISAEFDADNRDINWLIKVYRTVERSNTQSYLFSCSPSDLPIMDKIRDEYGTGNYAARVYKNGKLYRMIRYAIEAPKPDIIKPSSNDLSAIQQLMAQQAAIMERLFAKLTEQLNIPNNQIVPIIDPMQTMKSTIELIAPLLSMANRPQQDNSSKMMEIFLQGITVAKELGGNSGESNMLDLMRDFVKSPMMEGLATAALQAQASQTAPKPAIALQPQMQPNISPEKIIQSNPPVNDKVNSEVDDMVIFKMYISQLVEKAKENADTELYAEFICDNIDEATTIALVNNPNLKDVLAEYNQEVVPNWPWFEKLIISVKEILAEEELMRNDPEHASGTTSAPIVANGDT